MYENLIIYILKQLIVSPQLSVALQYDLTALVSEQWSVSTVHSAQGGQLVQNYGKEFSDSP